VLAADPASLVPCWLTLVAGELAPPPDELLLAMLGTSEGHALDETIVPVLMRHASTLFDSITAAIVESPADEHDYRAILYEVLLAVVIGRDLALRQRLRDFAEQRLAVEQDVPAEQAAFIIAALRQPQAESLIDEDDRLSRTSQILGSDWRQTAEHIAQRFAGVADSLR
jgi:hypothetical protein